MCAPKVAVYALAALAALEICPKTQQSLDPTSTRPIQSNPAAASAAEVEPIAAIAPPERAATQNFGKSVAIRTGNIRQPSSPSGLSDVADHWAQPFIEALKSDGIIRGFPDSTFRPDAPIETAHFAAMLQRAIEKHGVRFLIRHANDVLSGNQGPSALTALLPPTLAIPALEAQENRVIAANADRAAAASQSSGSSVTRAEAAAFLYEALAKSGFVASLSTAPPDRAVMGSAGLRKDIHTPVFISAQEWASLPASSVTPTQAPSPVKPDPVVESQPPAGVVIRADGSGQSSVPSSVPSVSPPESVQPSPTPAASTGAVDAAGVDAVKPAEAASQLGALATGKNARNFQDYWKTLCQNNPAVVSDALAACDQLLVLNPKDAALWAIRGNLLLAAGKSNEAVASYDRALALAPETSELHANRCKALSELGNQEGAIADCDRAIQLNKAWGNGTPAAAWFSKGTALKRLGRNQDASAAYERALALQPNYSLAWAEQCRVQSELGQQDAALAACNQALAVNGNWGDRTPALAWYNRGVALTRLEKYAEAIAAYEQALSIHPKDALIWTKQGALYSKLGKHSEALTSHDQALKISPNYSLALVNRCAALSKLGNYEAALAACEAALAGDGRWNEQGVAYAWDQRSVALAGLNRLEEALGSADRAVTIKPDFAEAWSNRAVTLWRMQNSIAALASADRAVALKPNYSQGWFNKGRILRTLERFEAAIAAYDQALKGDIPPTDKPTLADIWANRSAALWKSGNYQAALESANRSVEIDPKSTLGWFNRGGILMALQQPQEAAISYQQATQLDPTYVYAWTGQGMALERSGNYRAALTALNEALKRDPGQPLAQQSREVVLKKLEPAKPAAKRRLGKDEAAL